MIAEAGLDPVDCRHGEGELGAIRAGAVISEFHGVQSASGPVNHPARRAIAGP